VIIKVVRRSSDEYKIYRFLQDCPEAFDEDDFCCVLPPVDIIDFMDDHAFVVTPR
jgi:hypothetical protein